MLKSWGWGGVLWDYCISPVQIPFSFLLLGTLLAFHWGFGLGLDNISDIERVQKSAVRIICGKNYESYSDTLSELGMKSLAVRRNILCLKFAKKSLKIENFGHLFPLNSKSHNMKTRGSNC